MKQSEILLKCYRLYKCRNCGAVQKIATNHTGGCIDYCKECSWKPSFGKDIAIPMFGCQAYRRFEYYAEVKQS